MTSPSTTLYRCARVHSPAAPGATALRVTGETIAWVGAAADAPRADRTVDLGDALLTPAFVDAHVHSTDTGLARSGLDLSAARSAGEVLDAVAAFARTRPADEVVRGHGWDESTWADQCPPTAEELDRAVEGRRVYLSQASVHSALASSALLAAAPGVAAEPGYDPSGWLREQAHHAVRAVALGSLTAAQRRSAQVTALAAAAAVGIAAVHECGGRGTSSEEDFTALLRLSGDGRPQVYGYWGELMAAAKARELGAVGAGGDLYADGALGSRTAAVTEPYADGGGCGDAFVTAKEVAAHLVDCVRHGVQGGFHAIGDAAIGTVLDGFAAAAATVGVDRLRAGRHRIEHAELADRRMIARFVEFGVVASVQPAFDRLWGGQGRMYEQRLGPARSMAANPLGAMHAVGVTLAFGSDSPVTPLDPWGSVRAAVWHHNPAHRMSVRAAFAAHTRGGWRAVGGGPGGGGAGAGPGGGDHPQHGLLVPGAPATFAVWDVAGGLADGLPALPPGDPRGALPACRRTVLRGRTIFDAGGG